MAQSLQGLSYEICSTNIDDYAKDGGQGEV